MPPEDFGETLLFDVIDQGAAAPAQASQSPWDIAIRYHELKAGMKDQKQIHLMRTVSAWAVLEKAKRLLGSVSHPSMQRVSPLLEIAEDAEEVELDVEATLEESGLEWSTGQLTANDVWMSYRVRRKKRLVLCVDTSLSMTGEKLALTAVALAVVLLQFPNDPLGIVAFETSAKVLKQPHEEISVFDLVQRFLEVPAQGYTHLEDGLMSALQLQRYERKRSSGARNKALGRVSTVLVTDGKYTAGRDPAYLAHEFSHLEIIKMGIERAGLDLCEELARGGQGHLREVGELAELPQVMYSVVKDLVRGK